MQRGKGRASGWLGVPFDWAKAETNLGAALGMLGERESSAMRLETALLDWDDCVSVAAAAWAPEWIRRVPESKLPRALRSSAGRFDGPPKRGRGA